MSQSRWRIESRRVIAATLAGLPADATDAEKRLAVSRSYPFGPREHHPYRIWCSEVRLALPPGAAADRKSGEAAQADDAGAGPLFASREG